MPTEDKALRAVPVRRLEGHNGATKSDIREVFNNMYNKVFKSQNTQLLLRMEILVLILSMIGMCGVLMLMQANAQAQRGRRFPPEAPGLECRERRQLLLPDLDARFARVEPGKHGPG